MRMVTVAGMIAGSWLVTFAEGDGAPRFSGEMLEIPSFEQAISDARQESMVFSAKQLLPIDRTAIFPEDRAAELIDEVCYGIPKAAGYWTPEQKDLEGVEDTLLQFLRSKGDKWTTDLKWFRRQVTGVQRGDDRFLFISYFPFEPEPGAEWKRRNLPDYDPDSWRKEPHMVFDGGPSFFRVLYDLKNRRFVWYECNGEA